MMLKYSQLIKESYYLAFIFLVFAFPLAVVPVVFEGLQHIVEVNLGMFTPPEIKTFDPVKWNIRIGFGALKVMSILLSIILLPRYFINNRNIRQSLHLSVSAKKAALSAVVVTVISVLWAFIIGPWLLSLLDSSIAFMKRVLLSLCLWVGAGALMQSHVNNWLAKIYGEAPLLEQENKAISKVMLGGFSPVIVASFFPALALHYALNIFAMGKGFFLLSILLFIDSFVVGLLAALLGASCYVVYKDARR